MRLLRFTSSSICLVLAFATVASAGSLRMNQIQIIGSHNSYHAGLAPAEMELLRKQNPKVAESLDYRHAPIAAQLDSGVRQLELDVYGDSKGGRYADPLFLRLTSGKPGATPMPAGWKETMTKPGFKVLHVSDVDFRSHCWTFAACLAEVRQWSQAHARHLPIVIQIENKMTDEEQTARRPGFVPVEPVTKEALDALDAEIRSVFRKGEVITPDDVRGSHRTLREAVLSGKGWPELEKTRGKFIFVFDQERVTPLYVDGHPSLRGRMIFTNADPEAPDAAFVKVNNPDSPQIPELVRKGFLVRTMTDGGAAAVRAGDTRRRDQAIGSGAQILSTDYPFDWKAGSSEFHVELPGRVIARCNPVNAPAKACPAKILP